MSCVALTDGSIILMGGMGDHYLNDVWQSPDNGTTWTEMAANASWSPRWFPSSVAMPDGSILLMGGMTDNRGGTANDVWRSTDKGATWSLVTGHAGWAPRSYQSAVTLPDGSVVVLGGPWYDDVWRSADAGATWQRMTAHAGWTPRYGQTSVAMPDGSILLMGGYDTAKKNDIWISRDQGTTWERQDTRGGWDARTFPTSVAMPDGSVVLMGGEGNTSFRNDVWAFLPSGLPVPTKQPTPVPTTVIPTPAIITYKPPSSATEVRDARDPSRFIRLDPVQDFATNSSSMITGPTKITLTMTTNYPEESLIFFDIINEDSSGHLLTRNDPHPVFRGTGGLNTSSYTYDMAGQPFGHYRLEVTKANTNTTATARFNITPPGLWVWVWTDPIGTVYEGDNVTITGTTTLEPGINITLDMRMAPFHSCPFQLSGTPAVNQSEHGFCNHNCNSSPDMAIARVLPGTPGKNVWKASFNTTDWCWGEEYEFRPKIDGWINVTGGSSFRVERPVPR